MSRLSILATIALLLAPSSFAVPSPWRMKSNFAPPSANSNPGQGGWSPSNVQSTPSFGQSNGPTNQQPSSAIQPPPSSTSSVPLLSTGAVGQTTNGQTTTGQTTNGQTTNGQTTSGQNSTGQSYSQGSSSDLACSISDSASGSWCNADSNIYANDQTFQDQMMNATNFWRNNYGAKPVTWDATLASFANTQMAACIFDHTANRGIPDPYGENLGQNYNGPTAVVDGWGGEVSQYTSPGFSMATGHFTQLVWKATTAMGCGRKWCGGQNGVPGWLVACEYNPGGNGNADGGFTANVQT